MNELMDEWIDGFGNKGLKGLGLFLPTNKYKIWQIKKSPGRGFILTCTSRRGGQPAG
jgi:hypothetical protein